MCREIDDPELGRMMQIGVPVTLSRNPGAIRGPAPRLGNSFSPKQPFETPPEEGGSSGRTEESFPISTKTPAVRAEETPSFQGPSRSPIGAVQLGPLAGVLV